MGADDEDVDKANLGSYAAPGEIYVNPQDVEYEPNPVMFAHLRNECFPSVRSDLTRASVFPSIDSSHTLEISAPDLSFEDDPQGGAKSGPIDAIAQSLEPSVHNGPVAMPLDLPSFPCADCSEVFDRSYLRKHVLLRRLMFYFAKTS
jgi:hypothetical protein